MSCRVDKFVWFVRLAKTRSKATDAIAKGRIKLNGENVKPSKEIKVGDVISVVRHTSVFSFKALNLLDRRVGAKLVKDYLIDITPEEEIEKLKMYQAAQGNYRDYGTGKPSRKDRQSLEDFLENWE